MAEENLDPTKVLNQLEEIIPYLEDIAKRSMSVILLIPCQMELSPSLLRHWETTESAEKTSSTGREITKTCSPETDGRLAEQYFILSPEKLQKIEPRHLRLDYSGFTGVELGESREGMAMEPIGLKRKLTAILSADVEGYSRLMGEDEAGTIHTLTVYREVMTTLIQQHRGRVVDSPGDNLLAEFASAVGAVESAVAIQRELKTRNADLPAERRMVYRIGINVGEVVVEGERIYGDGVNIAARLESIADRGGICISGNVFELIRDKLAVGFKNLGNQKVKNINKPISAYSVLTDSDLAGRVISTPAKRVVRWKWPAVVATAVVILVAAGLAVW